jgi:hypothetical protein
MRWRIWRQRWLTSCDCGRARAGECRECNRRDAMEAKGDWAGEVADDLARFGC